MWRLFLKRMQCLFSRRGHVFMRRPLDPTMKQNSLTEIRCVHCELRVSDYLKG